MEKLVILDTNSLFYRFFYALPFFSSHQGIPTNALYGFTNALLRIIKEENPDYFIACFDSKVKTFRHYKDIAYKSQRPKISDHLKIQLNLAPKILNAFNISILEKQNYEADDLIGTLVKKNPDKFKIIFSGDLDLLQILDETTILKFFKKGISEVEIYNKEKIKEKFNLLPFQLADFKALVGDASDNIIGIKGIGKKTASELLIRFNNLEGIILAAEKKIISASLAKLILENREKLLLNKELATIICDLDLDLEIKRYPGIDEQKLFEVLKEFDFYSIIERLKKNNSYLKINQKINQLNNLSDKIFCLIDKNKIYFYDNFNFYFLDLKKENLEKIVQAKEVVIFDLKLFSKYYFQFVKKEFFDIDKFFDLKIAFWLTKNIVKPTIDKLFSYYSRNNNYSDNNEEIIKFLSHIYEDLNKEIENYQLKNILILEQKISLILALMEINGLTIDIKNLKDFKEKTQQQLKSLMEELYKLAGTKFNINSPYELKDVLFNKLKISPKKLKKTPKGEISIKESELIKIKDAHPFVEKLLEYRHNYKLLTSFYNNLLKYNQNGVIYPNFEITGTVTGRIITLLPNLQNLPSITRFIFVPRQGYIFVSYDYSQIELRILAHLSQDENLINIFYQDLDIHSITAKLLFKEENEKTRRLAKIINYGIVYGISARGIAQKTGLTIKEANDLIKSYFKNFPRIKILINDLIEKFKSFGYTETLLGRKRFFLDINSPKSLRIAVNTPIQGTAVDILKLAMLDIFNYLKDKNLLNDVKFILAIHDELIFEISETKLSEVKIKIKQIMENVLNLTVPLKVKIKEGYNLKDIK